MVEILRDSHREILAMAFALMVVAPAWLEVFLPRRAVARGRRWLPNLSLGAINITFFALAAPIGASAAALLAQAEGWGVLRLAALPSWLAIPVGIVALDAFSYVSHRLFHGLPMLWRLHHVHHSDLDLDFTTAVRHHPFEAMVNFLMLCVGTIAVGAAPESVVLYQFAASGLDFINHGNIRVPQRLDAGLRLLFVTPDMHLVHHSAGRRETDSNYGAILSLWDRALGTYVASPAETVTIGLEYRRASSDQRFDRVLLSPFGKMLPAGVGHRPAAAAVSSDLD